MIYDNTREKVPIGALDSSSAEYPQHDHHERDDQQQMDQAARDIHCEPKEPQDHEQYDDGPEHAVLPMPASLSARATRLRLQAECQSDRQDEK